MAALATGGGSSLINAQAWSGEITWDLLLGTNTLRNLHFNAPLSVSLQNDNFTLSLACDSYSIAQADAAIAAALVPYETAAQRDAAIAAALTAYSTTTETSAAIAAALLQYYTATQVDTQIASAVAGIDLTPYYTSTQTDAAITAALVPVTLSNAPAWGANPPTWELLKGSNVLRNLHFAGPLLASLQNNTDTLQLECDAYSKAETFAQAEVNSVVAGAIDALNVTQYRTEAQVSTAISDALAPYYTVAEVDAEIAANGFDGSQYYTRTQSDSRYFLQNASPGNVSLVRDNVTPPQVRGLVPRSPLGSSVLFSGTVLELTCDAYTKSEADGRYVQSGNLGSLDSRYFPVNGNNGGGGIFPMVITTLTPRMIRAILPRAPLTGALILGNAGTLELNCDCYSTSESDLRYYTKGQSDAAYAPLAVQAEQQANTSAIGALDSRVTALEGSGGVPADISCTSLTASSFVNTLNFTAWRLTCRCPPGATGGSQSTTSPARPRACSPTRSPRELETTC